MAARKLEIRGNLADSYADVFTPAAGYPPDLYVDGVRLLDQIWFDITW